MAEKTAYHVFREDRPDGSAVYMPVEANVQAHSAGDALRQAVTDTGIYVAVPARSFTPQKVTIATQTVVKVGD